MLGRDRDVNICKFYSTAIQIFYHLSLSYYLFLYVGLSTVILNCLKVCALIFFHPFARYPFVATLVSSEIER